MRSRELSCMKTMPADMLRAADGRPFTAGAAYATIDEFHMISMPSRAGDRCISRNIERLTRATVSPFIIAWHAGHASDSVDTNIDKRRLADEFTFAYLRRRCFDAKPLLLTPDRQSLRRD